MLRYSNFSLHDLLQFAHDSHSAEGCKRHFSIDHLNVSTPGWCANVGSFGEGLLRHGSLNRCFTLLDCCFGSAEYTRGSFEDWRT